MLVLAVVVAGLLLWNHFKPAPDAESETNPAATVTYTVRFNKWREGTSDMVQPGDDLADNVKNFNMGTVVSVESVPAVSSTLDAKDRRYVQAEIPGYEDVLVTVKSPCTLSGEDIVLDGGYVLKVGTLTYVRGVGYMGSGPVISIDREEQA